MSFILLPPVPQLFHMSNVDSVALAKIISSKLKNGSAPGPSGWTGELVAPLIDDPECLDGLGALTTDIINGALEDTSRSLLMASLLIAGAKPNGGVRPIAVSEAFYKLSTMYAISLVGDALPTIFEPIQFGVGAPGGPERAAHIIQAGLESMGPNTILLKCDIQNAFNQRKRSDILSELFKTPSLKPLYRLAHWAYRQSSPL